MQRPFSRLAIVNRGEPAMRVIHAVRELNEHRSEPLTLIALFTDSERDAMFVRHADEAICLGPSLTEDEHGTRRSGYLDHAALERALRAARADAAWVGWGFVAEQPEFAELCERLGIVFVGPDPAIMRLVGDKIAAKQLAEEAGVPIAPWSGGPVQDADEAVRHAEQIGFPLMIKAAAGGGGRGIRRVDDEATLADAFNSARTEAAQAFGDGTLLMEKLVTGARHIEVQIIADGQGTAWPVGVRDCSYQRRNQKVIEESASPALTPEQEDDVKEAAKRLALRSNYRNAGTVEFLYEPKSKRFSFMEVNARLQVEHPVTEAVTGIDLVKLQLHVASGGRLEGEPPPPLGHAIEARLNAEDPALGFAPAPGRLVLLRLPTGPGLRVDTGVSEGDVIPPEFDSMIGKLIAWGRDRDEALARLRRAVADTIVVVDGGTTNQGFLLELLTRPEVRTGDVDTSWLDRLYLSGDAVPVRHADVGLLQAAIELADESIATDRARFYAFARRGRPVADTSLVRTYELRHRGQSYRLSVAQIGPDEYRVSVDGQTMEIGLRRLGPHECRLEVGGQGFRTLTSTQGDDLLVEVNGVPHRISRDDGGVVHNLSPAVVVSIPVSPGDIVEAGDVVAVVEAMKMESSLTAPFHGRVKQVLVGENTHVAAQAPLVSLEQLDGSESAASAERVSFDELAITTEPVAPQRCHENLRRMERLVLGYDIARAEVERTITDLHEQCADMLACDPALIPGEHRLLTMFADLRALTLPRHLEDETEAVLIQSAEENLNAFLRSFEVEREGLPSGFVEQLQRALTYYGIDGLERTATLEDACYRLFLSQQRIEAARTGIIAILDRRLEDSEQLAGHVGDDFREALDRLVVAHEGRDPIIADLAREVRFRYFDEPIISEARERVYAEMREHVDRLARDPDTPDRDELISAIVDCPRPLSVLLTTSMTVADEAARLVLVEAMARRYYRVRSLAGFEREELDGYTFVRGRYRFQERQRHLGATYVELEDVGAAARAFMQDVAAVPEGELAVLDLYAEHRDEAPPHEELAKRLSDELAGMAIPPALHRIVIAVAEPRRGHGMSAIDLFTLRPDGDGLVEDEVIRGMHPMMAHRLQVWRLQEFELERLPSAEDIYAFHGVASTNPKDERLFALAEVRDLTRIHDDQGRVVALPELEQVVVRVLATIRAYQARRPLSKRLMWNRVLLHVWPVMEPDSYEIHRVVERLAPLTTGLGIEMMSFQGRVLEADGVVRRRVLQFFAPTGHHTSMEIADPPRRPLQPLDEATRRVIAARRRGMLHPAEVVRLLAPLHSTAGQPAGTFVEHDLNEDGELVPIERQPATNPSGIVVGMVRNFTERYPDGMERVILLGDPTRALGSLAEPECVRIMAAIDHAERLGVPLEWFALSAGAKIAMDSGTETMDWIAAVLRRIIEFTQNGGELNVVVAGINVGAQPYWNAEATMLMHTRGCLIMTPESAMVLTGKQALDYSGGVSAEDNFGIGGFERIMGPNGQAQYWARDLAGACRVLLSYYEHSYVAPGERFPRRATTADPPDRDVGEAEHTMAGSSLQRIGDVFSDATNPDRKQPFDIRSVMRAVIDSDHTPLERWPAMHDAEIGVIWDAHLGGWPVSLIGIESRPLPRHGTIPADGPEQWTSGTLFPRSSKKIARAINSVAGRRPIVVLANLAGFDGSPESMREWQLEYGAEIGRAIVNFDGPIVFCVLSRYHGGAFVVFSQRLNPNFEAVAIEGAKASVIGGAPAAAVVFARDVEQAARQDPRVAALDEQIAGAEGAERQRLRAERVKLWDEVLAKCRKEFADRFDAVHSIERAVEVGSVSEIIAPATLRPFLIGAVERGMSRIAPSTTQSTDGRSGMAEPIAG
jgi:acetyl/propionyl-CoA carboxylase alpha subunit/acetyl-CoA carboxylase carboxyltransferase component